MNIMPGASGTGQDLEISGDTADSCETCGALVDLSKSVLLRRNRVVGCPACNWGVAASPSGRQRGALRSLSL